ncbi:glycosyltransferase [Winogradskyella maritima]|uniref:Glycosyltransferase n=1 Tax=Winogradskyella maritima TaxID=1517766 RepID=A0ABV8AJE4_9FLAO|nr:glycosyltransferase [Winogradskyella maritima]
MQNQNKKIGLIVDCLSFGGAERAAAIASQLFHKAGYDVLIVTLKPEVSYNYSGRLVHLGESVSSIKPIKQFQKLWRLRKIIKENPNTIWIDYRMRNRWWMEYLIYQTSFKNETVIYTVHNYHIDYHIPKGDFFRKLYAKATVTSVSKGIQTRLKNEKGVDSHYLPNPIDRQRIFDKSMAHSVEGNYVVAVGRLLNSVKQFDLLIEAYSNSNLRTKGIRLKILGEGPDYDVLKRQIASLGLDNHVELLGFVENPYPYIKSAKFLCLTSKFEGLPMVILEALSLKTPVLAFDCPSGPSEMIIYNKNGILVENQNTNDLVDTLNTLAEDSEFLNKLSETNPEIDLKNYSLEQHLESWKVIFKTL